MIRAMRTLPILLLAIASLLIPTSLSAQKEYESAEITYQFQDGAYLSLQDFLTNKPSIPITKMVNRKGKPIKKIKHTDTAYYQLDGGTEPSEIPEFTIFGIASEGVFYMHGDYEYVRYFGKLEALGTICRYKCFTFPFAAYGTGIEISFFTDTETGITYPLDLPTFKRFLNSRDPELYKEFIAEEPGWRGLKLAEYIDKFNVKHPSKNWN